VENEAFVMVLNIPAGEKYRRCLVCLVMMFVSTMLEVGVTQHRSIDNVSRIIEDLLETYDIRLRPRFGGE